MKVKKITSFEQMEALPDGKWIEVEQGMDFEVLDLTSRRRPARVTIPLKPAVARSLSTRPGEVLEAHVREGQLEVVRKRARRKSART